MSETKVCQHPSLTPTLFSLLKERDLDLTVAEMHTRKINYLVEAIFRVEMLNSSTTEAQDFLQDAHSKAVEIGRDVTEYILLRELHEYLKHIPKLERYK